MDPNQAVALYHLGVIAHENGQLEQAVQWIVQSLQADSNNVEALNALAGVLKDQQRFSEALEFYQAALVISPHEAYLHSNLGLVFNELQRTDEAMACFQRALQMNPKWYASYSNMGGIYQREGKWERALECYVQALAVNPKSAVVLTNVGTILADQDRLDEALRYHQAALKSAPESDLVHNNLGTVLQKLGRVSESIECYQRALKYNPNSYLALSNLGSALWEQHQAAAAIDSLKKALALNPHCFMALNSLGAIFKEQGLVEKAMACFYKALELQPGVKDGIVPKIYRNLGATCFAAGRSKESVDWYRKSLELIPDSAGTFSDLLLVLNHLQIPPDCLFGEHLRFGQKFNSLRDSQPHPNSPDPDRRLRVGFVSGDLRNHAVAYFVEPIFTSYSKNQFEIFCYANHPEDDTVSERLKAKVDGWQKIIALSDEAVARQIRNDQIDILVDLSGHTALNRLLVFARKPAPVQVSMIGYIQTTGLAAMDYRVTDQSLDPVGETDHFNTEKLWRMAAGGSPFQPPANCPPVNELPAFKNGYLTFASFNKLSKITPEVIEVWVRLLKAIPDSRLLIASVTCDRLATELAAHGIGIERLELHPPMPMLDYLELHHRVDFYLDPFPYNGGTTNLLSLWMGVPFVSLEGTSAVGRSGACLLRSYGLEELVAANPQDYVEKALAFTRDLKRLADWRQNLRQYLTPALMSSKTMFTEELEAAFRQMWRAWCKEALTVKAVEPAVADNRAPKFVDHQY